MTTGPLVDELRRKGRDDVAELWRKTRAEAAGYEAARIRDREERNRAGAQQLAARSGALERAALAAAEATARKNVAIAKAALADRLHTLAVALLADFRDDRYPDLFRALAAELPSRVWERVVVNPQDRAAAEDACPKAEVKTDVSITGGIEVEEGRVRVSNTLEARLESAWPDILPALMKEILQEVTHS